MSINVTSNYCGEDSGLIIGKALLSGDTLDKQLLTILPEVKKSINVTAADMTNVVQPADCDFTALGDLNLVDRTLSPEEYKVNLEFCKLTLKNYWGAAQMQAGALNTDIPDNLADFILDYTAAKVAANIDTKIWQADSAGPDTFDGFLKKMFDDATVVDVTFTAVTLVNVITQIQLVYNAIPAAVCDDAEGVLIVSKDVAKFYKQAIAAASAEKYYIGDVPLDFLGTEICPIKGLPASTILWARKSNLFFGTDLMSDFNSAETIDMQKTLGSRNVRVLMAFSLDVQFAHGNEIVLHQNLFV
jgi:hypothetical protein